MSCKSAIYTANNTTIAAALDSLLPIGTIVRRFGNITANGNEINLMGSGYYEVTVHATVAPTAIGNATLTLYQNGVPVVGGSASGTATAANDEIPMEFTTIIRIPNYSNASVLTVQLSDGAADITNFGITVKKL